MSAPGTTDLKLKLHGTAHMGGLVSYEVFVRKNQALLKGLKAVDRSKNGNSKTHSYVVQEMAVGSAVLGLHEKRMTIKKARFSPTQQLVERGRQLSIGGNVLSSDQPILDVLEDLCAGSGESFEYGTLVGRDSSEIIRIDRNLKKKVHAAKVAMHNDNDQPEFFVGHSRGSFDGRLLMIDAQKHDDLPEGTFCLTSGQVSIPCILKLDIEEVRQLFYERVIVEGEAVYNGESALPERLEIEAIRQIDGQGLLRWAGKLQHWEIPEWGIGDN